MPSTKDLVLQYTDSDYKGMIMALGKTEEDVDEMVEELLKWRISQPHLPKTENINKLKCMLLINKYNVQKTKWKLDNYYSFRNFYPYFYDNRELLNNPPIEQILETVLLLPLPKLFQNKYRICLVRLLDPNPDVFNLQAMFKVTFAVGDIRLKYDKCLSDIFIIDFTNVHFRHMLKVNLIKIKQSFDIIKSVFSTRILQIHIVNCPAYARYFIAFIRSFLPKKLADRIQMHTSPETLKDFIDVNVLPEEYGGTAGSWNELYATWKTFLREENDWISKETFNKSNEALRPKNFKIT